jgi:hypothetical protein
MKKYILNIIILISSSIFGQVNIGNQLPVDDNVILDLKNTSNRVLLLSQPTTLPTSPAGLVFYDNTKDLIFLFKRWSKFKCIFCLEL